MKEKIFYYRAHNTLGQIQQGNIIALNKVIARQRLMDKGFYRIRLQQDWRLSNKPKNNEICALLSQLAMLLQSSIELKHALHIARDNCNQPALYQWLQSLIGHLESGFSFSQAIEAQGKYLDRQELQLLQAGELSGQLANVCLHLAEHRKRALLLQHKLQKIMLYPLIVLGISVVLTAILLIFVVPQFAAMYGTNGNELPPLTEFLLVLSEFIRQYPIPLLIFPLLIAIIWRQALRYSLMLNQYKAQLIGQAPIFGKIIALSRLVKFSHSLALMLQSGVPLNAALNSFLEIPKSWQKNPLQQGDPVLQQEVRNLLQWVEQGYLFSASVSSLLFPMEAQQMLAIGEQSGRLAEMLQNIAQDHQHKLDHQIDLLSQMLEPCLMLIIGGLIGMVMLGMYLPIFNMGSIIQ